VRVAPTSLPRRAAPRPPLPLLLKPIYLAKPWGGRRLERDLGRRDLPAGAVGESWEVADTDEQRSVVDGGPFDGRALRDVVGAPFPLLVKVIDAHEDLSVQVHPDGKDGVPAKEEAWVALADGGDVAVAPAGAVANERPWRERLERRRLHGPSEDARRAPSLVHVPAGTVHAILGGSLVWEVQTPIDVTWRLDDHGRVDAQGRSRPLHLREAERVLSRGAEPLGEVAPDGRTLFAHRFVVECYPPGEVEAPWALLAFFLGGGEVLWREGAAVRRAAVPPARTVVLPKETVGWTSRGWILAADVR
jgi:mannose-6-phosphate isomerase